MKDSPLENDEHVSDRAPSLWQENHGNLLAAFVASIFVVGAGILIYQQNRFVEPRFPDGRSIETIPPTSASEGDADSRVTVRIVGAANDQGLVMVALYDEESVFNEPENARLSGAVAITDGEALWSVPHARLPEKFAVAAYHDENGDHTLNVNRFGIPMERYGFTQEARGLTGPPAYAEAAIERPAAGGSLEVFIR